MRTVLLTFPEVDHPSVPCYLQALPQQLRCRSQTTSDRSGRLALFRRQPAGMLRVELLYVPHVLPQDRAAASPQGQLDVRIPGGQKLECRQPGPPSNVKSTGLFPSPPRAVSERLGCHRPGDNDEGKRVVEPGRGTFAALARRLNDRIQA